MHNKRKRGKELSESDFEVALLKRIRESASPAQKAAAIKALLMAELVHQSSEATSDDAQTAHS